MSLPSDDQIDEALPPSPGVSPSKSKLRQVLKQLRDVMASCVQKTETHFESATRCRGATSQINVLDFIPSVQHAAIRSGTSHYDASFDIQSAINVRLGKADLEKVVYFPYGVYRVSNLEITDDQNKTSLISPVSRGAILEYNGTTEPTSCVLRLRNKSFGTLAGLTMRGTPSHVPNNIIRQELDASIDMMFSIEHCAFGLCLGDAIYLDRIVNCYINHVRFDGINGYCLRVKGERNTERRPIVIQNFTVDNNIDSRIGRTIGTFAQNGPSETAVGKGIVHLDPGHGYRLKLSNARIEFNRELNTSRPCLVFDDTRERFSACHILLDSITGYFQISRGQGRSPLVWSRKGAVKVVAFNCDFASNALLRIDGELYDVGKVFQDTLATYNGNLQQDQGLSFGRTGIFQRQIASLNNSFDFIPGGSLNLRGTYNPRSESPLHVCDEPNGLLTQGAGSIIADGVITRKGSTVVHLPDGSIHPPKGAAVLLSGVGADGNDLAAAIIGILPFGRGLTLNVAALKSSTSSIMRYKQPVFKDISQVVGPKRYSGVPITNDPGFYNSRKDEISISRGASSNWQPDAWVCLISGGKQSSGRWRVFGTNSGTSAERTEKLQPLLGLNDAGLCYWDSDLQKAVFWSGSDWRFADGLVLPAST